MRGNAGGGEPLSMALRIGNKNDARDAIEELLQHQTPAQISKHFTEQSRRPFTGKTSRESQFYTSLSPEQKVTYQKAREARAKLGRDAIVQLSQYLAQNRYVPAD